MAAPKLKKNETFQPSRDSNRIIPCQGGFAYISDQFGKTRHLKVESDQFAKICLEVDEFFDGKISKELANLGWTFVLDNMERVRSTT